MHFNKQVLIVFLYYVNILVSQISPSTSPRKATIEPTTQRPTQNTYNFCLSGDDADTSTTNGYFYMGYYTENGTYNGRPYYVQHRTSFTPYTNNTVTQYPWIIYWTNTQWWISLSIGGLKYARCLIDVNYPRDCSNNWGRDWLQISFTKLNTKMGECDIVRCQTINVNSIDTRCTGIFTYVSDNIFENIEENSYWVYNDFLGIWICDYSIFTATDAQYTTTYYRSIGTTFPVLYDGITYVVDGHDGNPIIIQCNGCNGTSIQCITKNPTTSPTTFPTTQTPTKSPNTAIISPSIQEKNHIFIITSTNLPWIIVSILIVILLGIIICLCCFCGYCKKKTINTETEYGGSIVMTPTQNASSLVPLTQMKNSNDSSNKHKNSIFKNKNEGISKNNFTATF